MLLPVLAATANAQEFQSLFNGKDLSGWAGKTDFWPVKDAPGYGIVRAVMMVRISGTRVWLDRLDRPLAGLSIHQETG